MEKITDELCAGITDELTNDIDLFLINNIENKSTQLTIVELINKVYMEGMDKGLSIAEHRDEEYHKTLLAQDHDKFMNEFNKKLLDGQDQPVSQ